MFRRIFIKACLLSIVLGASFSDASGQEVRELWVTRVQAETESGLVATIQVESWEAKVDKDLPILITIKNNGKDPVYFVKKKNLEFFFKDKNNILIQSPIPYPDNKGEYDYSFHRIKPGEEFSDKVFIPHDLFKTRYELWICAGLGFVDDKTGLDRELKPGDDPISLRGPLSQRMEVIVLGELRVLLRRN